MAVFQVNLSFLPPLVPEEKLWDQNINSSHQKADCYAEHGFSVKVTVVATLQVV